MKLTRAQREQLRTKFGGRCAYCGEPLGERWHADHLLPVERKLEFDAENGRIRSTKEMWRPQNDTLDNMMPACPPCNIDKHSMSLEGWRRKLQGAANVLTRNNPTYRHAKRFGLVKETGATIQFHFESPNAPAQGPVGSSPGPAGAIGCASLDNNGEPK